MTELMEIRVISRVDTAIRAALEVRVAKAASVARVVLVVRMEAIIISITDRIIRTMVQIMEEIRMEIIQAVEQVIYAVTFGAQIPFVSVWAEIYADAFNTVNTGLCFCGKAANK